MRSSTALPGACTVLCGDAGARPAARDRVPGARRPGPHLPGFHGRESVRDVAARTPSGAAARASSSATRIRPTRRRPVPLNTSRGRGARCSASSTPRRTSGPSIFTANASQALKLDRRVVPVRAGRPVSADVRQPQLGERHPRVRARGGRGRDLRPGRAAGHARGRARPRRASSRDVRPGAPPLCSRIPRSRTSPACSTRSSGSRARRPRAGTSCSTRPRSRATNRLDLGDGRRTSSCSRSTSCSATPPASAACWPARRRSRSSRRPWFSGGTITVASVQGDKHYLAEGESAFEDGTLDYLALPAVEIGLAAHRVDRHRRDSRAGALPDRLAARATCWRCGRPTARRSSGSTVRRRPDRRGGIVTFNFYGADGRAIDHRIVEQHANAANISLRTGLFLQSGRRRNRARPDRHRAVVVLPPAGTRDPPDRSTTSSCASTARARAPCASRSAWSATTPTSTGSSRSPRGSSANDSQPPARRHSRDARHVRGRPLLYLRTAAWRHAASRCRSATRSSGSSSRISPSRTATSGRTTSCRTRTRFQHVIPTAAGHPADGRRLSRRRPRAELHVSGRAPPEAGVHRGHPPRQHERAPALQGVHRAVDGSRGLPVAPVRAAAAGRADRDDADRRDDGRLRAGGAERRAVPAATCRRRPIISSGTTSSASRPDDVRGLEYVYTAFFKGGPDLNYTFGRFHVLWRHAVSRPTRR